MLIWSCKVEKTTFYTKCAPATGWRVPGFLELLLSTNVSVHVCVSASRLLITSDVIWHDIDPYLLVKLWLLYGSCFSGCGVSIHTHHRN